MVGNRGLNSTEPFPTGAVLFCFLSADHISPEKIITPTMLINLPEELTTFHIVNASG